MLEHVVSIAAAAQAYSPHRQVTGQRKLLAVLLTASAGLALAALAGWVFDSIELVAVLPWLPTMKANTAIAFLALSVGIAASHLAAPARHLGAALLMVALAIALLSLAQSALGVDFGFDQWLLRDQLTTGREPPGRPAPATAMAVATLALGALLPMASRWRALPVLLAFFIGYTATVGLLIEARWSGALGQAFTTTSLPSAACILLLAAALLGDTVWRGSMLEQLATGSAGSQLLRVVLPLAMLAPAAVMWLQHLASHHDWWDVHGGLAIAATVSALLFMAVAVRAARWIDRLQADLSAANSSLEQRIAQRTQTLAELQLAHDALEAALRTRADFLSHVSHELRTPLNAILGFAQLLQTDRQRKLDEHQRAQLGHVVTAGHQLTMLVDDLLDFAHVDAGRLPMSRRTENTAELARLATAQIGPQAAAAGIAVHFEPPAPAPNPWVSVDRGRLLQVLANLLSNAVKYGGGSVRVEVRGDAHEVIIAVTDNGAGIRPEQLGQLFVPFSRLGRQGGQVAGSGIGLALSQRLMALMGGRISVRSEPGVGSTFLVHLPAAAPP